MCTPGMLTRCFILWCARRTLQTLLIKLQMFKANVRMSQSWVSSMHACFFFGCILSPYHIHTKVPTGMSLHDSRCVLAIAHHIIHLMPFTRKAARALLIESWPGFRCSTPCYSTTQHLSRITSRALPFAVCRLRVLMNPLSCLCPVASHIYYSWI